jgi:tetratricopeptide (TPR) repeat protein
MAVKLNPKLAYGHSMLATAKAGKLDWAGAEEARQEAIRLNPNSQEILLESALNLACMGRTNEALRDLEKARLANPESASNTRELFYRLVYGWCRQYDKALEIYGRTGTGSYFANQHRALAHLGAGDFTNFMRFAKQAALAKAENVDQVNAEFEVLTKAFEEGGPQKYWELSLTFETSKRDADHPMRMAAIHAQLDKPREAFLYLRRAMRESPNWFSTGLYTNPSFDSLRTNAQFTAMVEELWRWK